MAPEVVWKRLPDWDAAPEWMSGIDTMAAGGPTAVGTTLVFLSRGKPRERKITPVVAGREVTLTSRQGPACANYTYRCEGNAGATRVHLVADCEMTARCESSRRSCAS